MRWKLRTVLLLLHTSIVACDIVEELPFCENSKTGLILVSTIDGLLTALELNGDQVWQMNTGPGPLLTSNIHELELTNNGQWIRIIPSLSGTLYKFNGITVDPIHITANNLLMSSFKYSDDLVIAGSRDVRTYGIDFYTGANLYECSWEGCKNTTEGPRSAAQDVLVIERKTHIVRAVEPRSGIEKWNFSVGEHSIKLPQVSCINYDPKRNHFNITAVVPEGKLVATSIGADVQVLWERIFESPIVSVWKWDGRELLKLNLFGNIASPNRDNEVYPAIYIGMHNKQLYVHESSDLHNSLEAIRRNFDAEGIHNQIQIPWKAFPATNPSVPITDEENSTTALSVLYGSDYINGNGYYLYDLNGLNKKEMGLCENNTTITMNGVSDQSKGILAYWKEMCMILVSTITAWRIIFNCASTGFGRNSTGSKKDVIFVERQIRVPSTSSSGSELSSLLYTSRYESDFEPLSCLGRGGFGVVFKVKKKFDECDYAIKRITLPNDPAAKERMMREVKALAKLDHKHIVRYYNAWLESPPPGWQNEHDQRWIDECSISVLSNTSKEELREEDSDKSQCFVIDVPSKSPLVPKYVNSNTDSYVIFESGSNISETSSTSTTTTEVLNNSGTNLTFTKCQTFLYIQMQLCHQESLKDWLRKNFHRNIENVLEIFQQIVEAVEYVHFNGLIHRDLKPSNIFFSMDGQVKVGDFGLVTGIKDYGNNSIMSPTCTASSKGYTEAVGTHLYMSPEQYEGRKYNYKVDIYSLGIILFELLVGFSTEMERVDVLTQLRNQIFPTNFLDKYPKEYELLRMMLSKDPENRPTATGIRTRPPLLKEAAIAKMDLLSSKC